MFCQKNIYIFVDNLFFFVAKMKNLSSNKNETQEDREGLIKGIEDSMRF